MLIDDAIGTALVSEGVGNLWPVGPPGGLRMVKYITPRKYRGEITRVIYEFIFGTHIYIYILNLLYIYI